MSAYDPALPGMIQQVALVAVAEALSPAPTVDALRRREAATGAADRIHSAVVALGSLDLGALNQIGFALRLLMVLHAECGRSAYSIAGLIALFGREPWATFDARVAELEPRVAAMLAALPAPQR